LALIVFDIAQRPAAPPAPQARWPAAIAPAAPKAASLQRIGAGSVPMPPGTPAAHASSLLAMPAGHPAALTAFWFAGTQESAPDVQIVAAQFDRASQRWGEAQVVVNRQVLGESLGFGVRRLGNPVAWLDASGRMHLWVVATGAGGWAASRIAHLRQTRPVLPATQGSAATAMHFDTQRVLPLSWLWNTSYLVRNAPLALQDGGMLLPVHFELGIKYPVALRFDRMGDFLGMVRLSRRTHVLQPSLLTLDERHWLALMRDQRPNGRIAVAATGDGGQNWQDLPDLALTNPDAAVAALALAPGSLLLAHNSSERSRHRLELSSSTDGQAWQRLQVLAQGTPGQEFSYPALAWADDSLWVSYTEERQRIAWQRFAVPAQPAMGKPAP
jgi:predicted neuraminidase